MKAQVTLFVVLGIVVMIILGFGILIKDMILQNRISESADTIFEELEQASNLNAHMKLCLKDLTKNGLHLLGVQGGYIYVNQGGTQTRPANTVVNTQNNLLGIPEDYRMAQWILNQENDGKFAVIIPKLCSNTGPNRIGVSNLSVNSCKLISVFGEEGNNIQDSLASYINTALPDCLSIEEHATKNGNKITPGDPKTEVILDENSFLVHVEYPFEIKIRGEEPQFMQSNYTHEEKSRLQTIYNLLFTSSSQESINPNYHFESEIVNNPFFRQGFVVIIEENWVDNTHLVWLKDEKSLINGQPYTFMFGIEDRDPVGINDYDD